MKLPGTANKISFNMYSKNYLNLTSTIDLTIFALIFFK